MKTIFEVPVPGEEFVIENAFQIAARENAAVVVAKVKGFDVLSLVKGENASQKAMMVSSLFLDSSKEKDSWYDSKLYFLAAGLLYVKADPDADMEDVVSFWKDMCGLNGQPVLKEAFEKLNALPSGAAKNMWNAYRSLSPSVQGSICVEMATAVFPEKRRYKTLEPKPFENEIPGSVGEFLESNSTGKVNPPNDAEDLSHEPPNGLMANERARSLTAEDKAFAGIEMAEDARRESKSGGKSILKGLFSKKED